VYSAARAEIEIVMSNANRPGFSELMATAKVMLGETFMARKDYDRAIDYYEDMARKGEGQGSQAAAGAFVNLARAYRARNKNDDKRRALKTYLAVTIYYAGALEAYAEALYSAGELLDEKGEKEQAKAYYRELKARCKGTSWARKAP
jgi:TolA-binding protein